ncbi:unnamed protein product [Laminaria digitata]
MQSPGHQKVKAGRALVEAEAAKSAAAAAVEAVEAEAAQSAAAATVAAVAATVAAQLVEKGLARVEERVRDLEASLDRPANGDARVSKTTSRSPRAASSDRGRRSKRSAKLAPCSLSRSPSRSCSRGRDRFPPPPLPPAATEIPSNPKSTSKIVLDAVEEGNAVARRAGEVAQEALMLGKEAAERSERAESLARSLTTGPVAPTEEEKHGEATDALERTDDKKARRKSGRGNRQRPADQAVEYGVDPTEEMGGTDTDTTPAATAAAAAAAAVTAADSRRDRRLRAVSAILGEAGRNMGSAVPDSTSSGTPAAPWGGEISRRPGHEAHNRLERLQADSDNGRRTAFSAIRTKLESLALEVPPGQLDRRVEGEKGGGGRGEAPVGKGDDLRKVVELREAIWGAVGILSGING